MHCNSVKISHLLTCFMPLITLKNNFKSVVVKPASRNRTKDQIIVYGARKSRKTQLLATMLNPKTSQEVTKFAPCRQGSKITKGYPSETCLSKTAKVSKQECLLICYRFSNIYSLAFSKLLVCFILS